MEQDESTLVGRAKELVAEFQGDLTSRVDRASISLKAKIPLKALALREALMYRMTDVAEGACQLYEMSSSNLIMTRTGRSAPSK